MGLDERILDSAETATPRTRTRMYGGVGGEERRLSPYPDFEAVYPQKSLQSLLLFARPPSAASLRALHGRRILEKCMTSDLRHGDQLYNGDTTAVA